MKLVLFLFFFLGQACTHTQSNSKTSKPQGAQVELADGSKLAVFPAMDPAKTSFYSYWFHLSDSYMASRFLGTGLAGMTQVNALSLSSDQKALAVESSGEGVSSLVVIEVPSLIKKASVNVIWNGDEVVHKCGPPFPGYIRLVKWKGNELLVESDKNLNDCSKKMLSGQMKKFMVQLKNGRISSVK